MEANLNRYIINVAVKVPDQIIVEACDPHSARDIARRDGYEVIEGTLGGAYSPCDEKVGKRKPYYFLREFTGGINHGS